MRGLVALLLLVVVMPAHAHVGSPDIFFEGEAGPYHVVVTIRTPDVIPGIATIELRTSEPVRGVTVVPLRLTGPGSELPPAPDDAERSPDDPQFFTAGLWLMEHGSLQVRIAVDGERGSGALAIPVPAVAQRTQQMAPVLGTLLFALMALLAVSLVSIFTAAVRESALEAGLEPGPRGKRRARIATIGVGGAVVALLAFGNWWWSLEARNYERMVAQPWVLAPRVEGCRLRLPDVTTDLLPDHGHDLHLFMLRAPGFDRLAHVHPVRDGSGFVVDLPPLPAGRYALFADVVLRTGFPVTGTGEIELPDLAGCAAPTGDDALWAGEPSKMIWDRPPVLRSGVTTTLRFRLEGARHIAAYMGMAGHCAVVRTDRSVFAHLHPSGSVAMPALDLALAGAGVERVSHEGHQMLFPPEVAFPYGFPKPGEYHVFVQVRLDGGRIETAAFTAVVE